MVHCTYNTVHVYIPDALQRLFSNLFTASAFNDPMIEGHGQSKDHYQWFWKIYVQDITLHSQWTDPDSFC